MAFSDGHDSQEIPEENTGINGLDIGVRIVGFQRLSEYSNKSSEYSFPLSS